MSDFDLQAMEKVVAFIGDPDEQSRRELRQILSHAGVKQISTHGSLASLTNMLGTVPPDLLMLSDDLDPKLFEFTAVTVQSDMGIRQFVQMLLQGYPSDRE